MKNTFRVLAVSVSLVLLFAALGVLPAIGAVAGTVTVDKTHITTPGGALTVTLNDKDLDTAQDVTDVPELTTEANDVDGNGIPENAFAGSDVDGDGILDDNNFVVVQHANAENGTVIDTFTGAAGALAQVGVSTFPILDRNADGTINSQDVQVWQTDAGGIEAISTTVRVFSLIAGEGLITLLAIGNPADADLNIDLDGSGVIAGGGGDGQSFKLVYKAASIETRDVKVVSGADINGFTLTLEETSAAVGIFSTAGVSVVTGSKSDPNTPNFTEDYESARVDTNLDDTVDATDNVDINGDGDTTDTDLIAGFYEAIYARDFDGDGNTTGVATSTLSEVTENVDLDGDGATTSTAVVPGLYEVPIGRFNGVNAGVDLDGDGAVSFTAITEFPANLFPNWPHRPTIAAISGSIVTFSYTDADPAATITGNSTVETTEPVVVISTPLHEAASQNPSVRIIADITDADSTVDATTISFNLVSAVDANGSPLTLGAGGIETGTVVSVAITGGFRADVTLTGVTAGETTITYNVTATDKAGNVGTSDSDATTATVNEDHVLKVDTLVPVFSTPDGAFTGQWWDAANTAIEFDSTKSKDTSIRLLFNEDLDGTTIQALDFTVAGAAPQNAEWFSGAADSVFLTVSKLASDAKPAIALVGPVSDKAGNSVSAGTVAAARDRIGPTITVSVNPTLDKKKVNIDIASDEALLLPPMVKVNGAPTAVPTLVGTNVFRTSFETTAASNAYNIEVTSQDTGSNILNSGVAAHDTTAAILFEIDNALAAPQTDPDAAGSVFTSSPFITINWTSEGNEYGLDAVGGNPISAAATTTTIAVDLDTHDKVTLSKVTLDGTDMLSLVATVDNRTFILATTNLPLGDHTLVFNGTDDAGNVLAADVSITFTVKIRPKFSVTIKPGWNLISLPGEPADTAIDTVIGTIPVDTVLSYDPTTPGGWLTAFRSSPNVAFVGTLAVMNANRAYWVHTSSFEAIDVVIPVSEAGVPVLLPAIDVVAGWNLVPVRDVTGTLTSGTQLAVSPAVYAQGLTINRIYHYDTLTQLFVNVAPALVPADPADPQPGVGLTVGQGYWVYFSAAGTLVP